MNLPRSCNSGTQTHRLVLHFVRANGQGSHRQNPEQLYGQRRTPSSHLSKLLKRVCVNTLAGHPVFVRNLDRRQPHVSLREYFVHRGVIGSNHLLEPLQAKSRMAYAYLVCPCVSIYLSIYLSIYIRQVGSGTTKERDAGVASMLDDRVDMLFKLIHIGTFMTSTQVRSCVS